VPHGLSQTAMQWAGMTFLNKELVTKLRPSCSNPRHAADWDETVHECAFTCNSTVHSVQVTA
jgi:hypothetical protein